MDLEAARDKEEDEHKRGASSGSHWRREGNGRPAGAALGGAPVSVLERRAGSSRVVHEGSGVQVPREGQRGGDRRRDLLRSEEKRRMQSPAGDR